MYKISAATNIGLGLMFAVSFWAAVDGAISFLWLAIFPVFYLILYFTISVFVWDKKRQVDIRLGANYFKKGDIIKIGNGDKMGLIVSVNDSIITVFPIKVTKSKRLNNLNYNYIKLSCWLRGVK